MSPLLLERAAPRAALLQAVARLVAGEPGVVLITGEAGVGKTSLLDAVLAELAEDPKPARVLRGACDDLVAANPLGPIKEATRPLDGAVAEIVATGGIDRVLTAVSNAFATVPTVLAVEDLHWADDATLDVLAYLARRIERTRMLLLVTYRDELSGDHPMQRFLAAVPVRRSARVVLTPLGLASVEQLSCGSRWDARQLYALTGGNPFYVTETLAAPSDAPVPRSIADAVLARLRRLSPAARRGVERISIWPGQLDFGVASDLLGPDLDALVEAEQAGVITVGSGGLSFRHELARRATEASLSQLDRRRMQHQVTELLRRQQAVELPRLVHHAIESGDAATIAEFAPQAGVQSSRAGAHRQALAFFAAALAHQDRLSPPVLAEVLDNYAWELYNAHRFAEAIEFAHRAVDAAAQLGDVAAQAGAMGRLSRHLFMQGDPDEARDTAAAAVELAAADESTSLAAAEVSLGVLLALDVTADSAPAVLQRARLLAQRIERRDLVALTLNYDSLARPDLAPDDRLAMMRDSIAAARHCGADEFVARGYTNLGELLYRYGRYDELERLLAEGLRFARERGFWSHTFNLEVHQALLWLRRGDWAGAESALRELLDRYADPGMLMVYSVPPYARLLARRGDPGAEPMLRQAWARARRQRMLIGLGLAGTALLEWAWLNQDETTGGQVVRTWTTIADRPTAPPLWAEIRRYALRLGIPTRTPENADPLQASGTADPWEAGLAGDWAGAAARWERIGDRYEQALELADSGQAEPMVRGLAELEELGADAAAADVRRRLRRLGASVPRGPRSSTRVNPGGLTERQLDIARLVAEGLTNTEIAERLVLSVRTVDHHVSTILAKLGVDSRRAAAAIVRTWS
jgi:DNA-binding CsgD family transcriptional regulator/tetratricopeptide (TPR) repeat protein